MIAYPNSAPSPSASSEQMIYLSAVQRYHRDGESYRIAVDEDNLPLHMRRQAFAEAVMFELLAPRGYDARRDIFWDVFYCDFVNGCSLDAIAIMDYMAMDVTVGPRRTLTREDAEYYAPRIVDQWWPTAIETIIYYRDHKAPDRRRDVRQTRPGRGYISYWHLTSPSKCVCRDIVSKRRPVADLLHIVEAPDWATRAEFHDRAVIYYA